MKIQIKSHNRVMLVGMTGSGKSELSKFLLSNLRRAIVIDPKHTFRLEGYKVARSMPLFENEFRIILRPKRSDDFYFGDLIREAWKRRNIILYCDELATLDDSFPEMTRQLAECARTGRERGIGLWTATQRPRGIPQIFKTESEVFFVFTLQSEEDRKHVSGFVGEKAKIDLPEHIFLYRNKKKDSAFYTLDVDRQIILPVEESELQEVDL